MSYSKFLIDIREKSENMNINHSKVLFIVANANCLGGTEIVAFNLLQELNNIGISCSLLSIIPYKGDNPLVISFTNREYQLWSRKNKLLLNKLLGDQLSDSILQNLIVNKAKEICADWIVNHTYDFVAAIPTNSTLSTAQVFNWSIKGYEESITQIISRKGGLTKFFSTISFNLIKRRWHQAFTRFNKLILLTDAAREEIKEVSPSVQLSQLITIPNPLMRDADSLQVSTLQTNNLVFVGRLSHEKGVMRLLRIWEYVHIRLPQCTLNIYGDGDAKREMLEYIIHHNLPRIQFKGFNTNIEQIYTQSDLLMLTSETEGFGMVIIEAMYYGVPCISFDCPVSPKEIIRDAGVIIPCFDEMQYADEVIRLMTNQPRLQNLQQKCIIRARDFFKSKVIKTWKELIISSR